jgi:hypothetical protein
VQIARILEPKVTFAKIVYDDRNTDMHAIMSNTKGCFLHFADQTIEELRKVLRRRIVDCED